MVPAPRKYHAKSPVSLWHPTPLPQFVLSIRKKRTSRKILLKVDLRDRHTCPQFFYVQRGYRKVTSYADTCPVLSSGTDCRDAHASIAGSSRDVSEQVERSGNT